MTIIMRIGNYKMLSMASSIMVVHAAGLSELRHKRI